MPFYRLKGELEPLPPYFCMKFDYSELDHCIGRCITNQVFFNECYLVCKSHFRINGCYRNKLFAKFYPDSITNQQSLIRRMFSSVWGTLKMMDTQKLRLEVVPILILNETRQSI